MVSIWALSPLTVIRSSVPFVSPSTISSLFGPKARSPSEWNSGRDVCSFVIVPALPSAFTATRYSPSPWKMLA